jgi:two-component system cell cycle sensor histidine kinase PleC
MIPAPLPEPGLSTSSDFLGQRRLRESVAAAGAHAGNACRHAVSTLFQSYHPSESSAWLVEAQLDLYRQSTRYFALLIPIGAFFIEQACAPWIARSTRLAWWGAMLLLCIALDLVGRRLDANSDGSLAALRRRVKIFTGLNAVFLIAWCSMSVFLWAPGEPVNHMMLILILACSLAGSITITAVHPASAVIVFVSHAIFIVAPLVLSPGALDHTLAWLAAVFIALMAGQVVALSASMTKMLTLEHERTGMVAGLQRAVENSERERARAGVAGRTKPQFLSNMNHELRTPMNAILGFSELMKNTSYGTTPDKCAEYAGIIHESGRNLLSLIDGMLDLAKIEGGKLYLRECDFSLAHLISEAVAENEKTASEKNISLARKIERGLPHMHADERGVRQIVANLLSNALKFTPPGGCVTAFARLDPDGRIAFGVEDTGLGIAAEDQSHVFERFGHGRHDVATADKGTGLGLAIVKGFAEAHDGEVVLDSDLGNGTRVTVYLPNERVVVAPATRSAVA